MPQVAKITRYIDINHGFTSFWARTFVVFNNAIIYFLVEHALVSIRFFIKWEAPVFNRTRGFFCVREGAHSSLFQQLAQGADFGK